MMRCHIHLIAGAFVLGAVLFASLLAGTVQAERVLVGYWALDDGVANPSTMTAVDSATPPASDGTLTPNTASWGTPTWDTGYLGGCLKFDGTNDRVSMGDPDELDLTGDLTLDFWLKPNGEGAQKYGPLVGKNQSGGASGDAYFTAIVYDNSVSGEAVSATLPKGTIEFGITSGTPGMNTLLRSATPIALNTTDWHHVRCEYDAGTRMTIYLDGVKSSELTTGVPAACNATTNNFALGNLGGADSAIAYCYKGLLDEVRVYNGVVPEPACLALLASGLLALALRHRTRG